MKLYSHHVGKLLTPYLGIIFLFQNIMFQKAALQEMELSVEK